MYAVILCGGSGTRLWPLSRKNYPKQFLKLYSDFSLLQETFMRAEKLTHCRNIFLVTNKENYFNVLNQIRDICPKIKEKQIIIEPLSLDTAPALTLSIKYLREKIKIKDADQVASFHSDHYIGDVPKFIKTIKNAFKKIGDNIGVIGINPTSPKTNYGYIKKGKQRNGYHLVEKFKEKPDLNTAQKYFSAGDYLWNSGIYLFTAKTFERELKKHAPNIYSLYQQNWNDFLGNFKKMPTAPMDVIISEKSKKMIVFDSNFTWNDIGSFDNLAEISKNRNEKNRHIFIDTKNVFAHSSTNRLIATLGVENLSVIENNDCILVYGHGHNDKIKNLVNHLKEKQYKELEHNVIVHRPWGKYEVLIDEKNHKVKKITIFPKASLSLQSHKHRSEHWVVVKGTAKVINGDKKFELKENQSVYISAGAKHRLSNPQKTHLEIIEVQTGNYLEEDDITRYEDQYNRMNPI